MTDSNEDNPSLYSKRAQTGEPSIAEDGGEQLTVHQQLLALQFEFGVQAERATDEAALYQLQVEYLGKKGSVTSLRSQMGNIPPADRKAFGQAFNEVKQAIEGRIEARKRELEGLARERELGRRVDLSFVADRRRAGTLHPITATRRALEQVFRRLGFDILEGPHVEAEDYNFDKLAFEPDHPARDTQDTFFVLARGLLDPALDRTVDRSDPTKSLVLRTHTSPVQVRTMLTHRPPIRIIAPGTVFRVDDDATHSPMFNQIEGLYIDEGVTMADLKATLYRFVGAFFGAGLEVRFRPSYFPFVEPGAEFDMQCPFCRQPSGESVGCSLCKQTGWIELGGSGMVDPAVFEHCGIDPDVYTGWAFGFGIDRMAMLRHAVPNLKLFFEGDLRFLEQYPC
ncbi:phenylalanine--tRNA ligase subunit alpha [Nannocystaceae bacterium ST9]